MEVFRAYAYATSAYLTLQSLPLLLAPRAIVLLTAHPATTSRATTDVESHLSRSLGLALLALALLVVLLTGAIPLKDIPLPSHNSNGIGAGATSGGRDPAAAPPPSAASLYSAPNASVVSFAPSLPASAADEADRLASPFVQATLIITTTYHACAAFNLYTRLTLSWSWPSSLALGGGSAVSGLLFAVGMWVLVFGGERARLSRSTGADKRTGNYPFENKESAREKKKEKERAEKVEAREGPEKKEGKEKERRRGILRTKSR